MTTTINITNNQTVIKKRRGCPRGYKRFTNVTLAELSKYVGPLGTVVASRKWLKTINFPMP